MTTDEVGSGAAAFAAELERSGLGRLIALSPLVERLRAPLGVQVVGRRGVGRSTVEAALRAEGVRLAGGDAGRDVEVRVLVIAEALKPEDATLLGATVPTLIVLTKADLLGSAGGPLAGGLRDARRVEAATGAPVEVMVGLLGVVRTLEPELWAALRTLVEEPAAFASVDAFVASEHQVGVEVRRRLLDRLDRFGVAHAVLALADGLDETAVLARLRELSNVDGVLTALRGRAAVAEYRRVRHVLSELRCLRTSSDDVARFLGARATAMAVMTAAVGVIEAAGLAVDRGDDRAAHARRALRWHAYGRGPVGALHRACAADITRGSLRLLEQVR